MMVLTGTNGTCWTVVRDGNLDVMAMVRSHYSHRRYADGRRQNRSNRNRNLFVGPGEKLVLITNGAVFAWRKFIDDCIDPRSGRRNEGVNNCIFRRTGGDVIASELIRQAVDLARVRWPKDRLYTYVDPDEVKSTHPGYCYLMAGWTFAFITKTGKWCYELLASASSATSAVKNPPKEKNTDDI